MSLTAFSQASTLKPLQIQYDSKGYLCFDYNQSKYIAAQIVQKQACDTIQSVNTQTIAIQDSIISSQRDQIKILKSVIEADKSQILNKTLENKVLANNMLKYEEKFKKERRKKNVAIIVATLLGVIAIVN